MLSFYKYQAVLGLPDFYSLTILPFPQMVVFGILTVQMLTLTRASCAIYFEEFADDWGVSILKYLLLCLLG